MASNNGDTLIKSVSLRNSHTARN